MINLLKFFENYEWEMQKIFNDSKNPEYTFSYWKWGEMEKMKVIQTKTANGMVKKIKKLLKNNKLN